MTGVELVAGTTQIVAARQVLIPEPAWGPKDVSGYRYAIVTIRTIDENAPQWSQPISITVRDARGHFDVVAIDRSVEAHD